MTTEPIAVRPIVEHELGPDGLVVVRLRTEDLRIRAIPGTVARLHDPDASDGEGLEVVRGPRSLEVRTGGLPGRDLLAEVPRGTNVVVETASSDIEVEGVIGDQRYRTASGDIDLQGVGGTITVESMSGDVDITGDGPAHFDVRSMSGDLRLRAGTITHLRAATTSGDVLVAGRFDGTGPFTLETVSGDVRLAPDTGARIEIRTITGDVRSDVPARLEETPGRRVLVVGGDGPTIAFRSTSGDLRVVRDIATGAGTAPIPSAAIEDGDDVGRLEILRALERGDLDVDEARRRLDALERGEEDHHA